MDQDHQQRDEDALALLQECLSQLPPIDPITGHQAVSSALKSCAYFASQTEGTVVDWDFQRHALDFSKAGEYLDALCELYEKGVFERGEITYNASKIPRVEEFVQRKSLSSMEQKKGPRQSHAFSPSAPRGLFPTSRRPPHDERVDATQHHSDSTSSSHDPEEDSSTSSPRGEGNPFGDTLTPIQRSQTLTTAQLQHLPLAQVCLVLTSLVESAQQCVSSGRLRILALRCLQVLATLCPLALEERVLPTLHHLLLDPAPAVRRSAVKALVRILPRATSALASEAFFVEYVMPQLIMAGNDEPNVQLAVAHNLERILRPFLEEGWLSSPGSRGEGGGDAGAGAGEGAEDFGAGEGEAVRGRADNFSGAGRRSGGKGERTAGALEDSFQKLIKALLGPTGGEGSEKIPTEAAKSESIVLQKAVGGLFGTN